MCICQKLFFANNSDSFSVASPSIADEYIIAYIDELFW